MKVFVFFVEPASYTVELINNVHKQKNIRYCFIKSNSYYIKGKYNYTSLNNMIFYKRFIYILKVWKENNLIIVNGYNNYVFLFLWILNFFSSRKKNIGIESDTQYKPNIALGKSILKSLFLKIIFKSNYIFGLAGGTKTHFDLFSNYGMKRENIFLLPMVVNNSYFLRKDDYQVNKKFSFLIVSRLIKSKNIEPVIDFFLSHFKNKNAILKVVGDGPLHKKFLRKYNSNKVKFYGKLTKKNLVNQYHSSDVFLMPSYKESWGLVINEAMCSGLPIITRKEVGSNYDLITNNENGFTVNNDKDFFNKMITLFESHELCVSMSKKSIEIMKSTWNYNLYSNCLEKLYLFLKDK